MKSYKTLLNSLSTDSMLRQLTDQEMIQLRQTFIEIYCDLAACCEKNGITIMFAGGTALGAVRHKGFIPWDDDFDVAMPRKDFEKLKSIFEAELGDKYMLSSPNYKNQAKNRFPMMLMRNTLFVEFGQCPEDELSKIKIDIFVIENIPKCKIKRMIKGLWCYALMAAGSFVDTYEHQTEMFKRYMCKTKEGRLAYQRRLLLGRLFSFFDFQKWMNIIDSACQYKKDTGILGIPTGRKHYFGEILPSSTFLPVSKGDFEGITVNLPGNVHDYLCNLYGSDYMTLPPVEQRERHFFVDIKFKDK